jgi:hypothetical protein
MNMSILAADFRSGPDQEIPGPLNRDPRRFRFPAESGNGVPCFPAESGIGDSLPRFPAKKNGKTGDPIPDSRVTSEHQPQWTQ